MLNTSEALDLEKQSSLSLKNYFFNQKSPTGRFWVRSLPWETFLWKLLLSLPRFPVFVLSLALIPHFFSRSQSVVEESGLFPSYARGGSFDLIKVYWKQRVKNSLRVQRDNIVKSSQIKQDQKRFGAIYVEGWVGEKKNENGKNESTLRRQPSFNCLTCFRSLFDLLCAKREFWQWVVFWLGFRRDDSVVSKTRSRNM